MRRRIEALADAFEEFVSEDAHALLLIDCEGDAAPYVAAAVDLTEQRGSTDVHAVVVEALPEPCAPVLAAALSAHARTLALGLGLDGVLPAIGAEPAVSSLDVAVRELAAVARAAEAIGDVRVGVWIAPGAIACTHDHAEAMVRLAFLASAEPKLRLAIRSTSTLREALAHVPVTWRSVSFDASAEALRAAMAEEATDPSTHPDRAAALALTVAMSDAAQGRIAEALSVIGALAEHHRTRGDEGSRALCVVLCGNVRALEGDLAEARVLVAQGLALATEARAIPVVLMGGMLAGELALRAGDRDEADRRFDVVARVAAGVGSLPIAATALIARGRNLAARSELARARDVWLCAAELARRASAMGEMREALGLLRALFVDARMEPEITWADRVLSQLPVSASACAHAHEAP